MAQKISPWTGQNSNRANAAFTVGLLAILGALSFEHIGGLVPCELCLGQRVPYYVGLPLLAVLIGTWKIVPPILRVIATLIILAIFIWGTYLGAFHAGVEWGFWPGPTACTGNGEGLSFDALSDINAARVIPCDVVQFRFLGISLAGYNALISLLVSGLLAWSAIGQIKRMRA